MKEALGSEDYNQIQTGQFIDEDGVEHVFVTDKPSTRPSNKGLLFCGIVFAVAAIILFVVSIREVGNMVVANIQDTVFSAAAAVASVICFVGAKIVSSIGNTLRK